VSKLMELALPLNMLLPPAGLGAKVPSEFRLYTSKSVDIPSASDSPCEAMARQHPRAPTLEGGLLSWLKLSVVNAPVELLNTRKTTSSGTVPFGTVRNA